jgi:hypothetical protein
VHQRSRRFLASLLLLPIITVGAHAQTHVGGRWTRAGTYALTVEAPGFQAPRAPLPCEDRPRSAGAGRQNLSVSISP